MSAMSQITLQLTDSVLSGARKLADQQKMTVEDFLAKMVAQTVRHDNEWDARVQRGSQVTRERFLEILRKAPDVPPLPGDEIE